MNSILPLDYQLRLNNMREIKFRAWVERDKCWIGGFSIHKSGLFTDITGAKMVGSCCVAYANWQDLNEENKEGIHVDQFTGVLDKDGKEIYENDYVILTCEQPNYGIRKFKPKLVKWSNNLNSIGFNLGMGRNKKGGKYKIIGNIYENPELLNKQG